MFWPTFPYLPFSRCAKEILWPGEKGLPTARPVFRRVSLNLRFPATQRHRFHAPVEFGLGAYPHPFPGDVGCGGEGVRRIRAGATHLGINIANASNSTCQINSHFYFWENEKYRTQDKSIAQIRKDLPGGKNYDAVSGGFALTASG